VQIIGGKAQHQPADQRGQRGQRQRQSIKEEGNFRCQLAVPNQVLLPLSGMP
jgi:hypothetical protein